MRQRWQTRRMKALVQSGSAMSGIRVPEVLGVLAGLPTVEAYVTHQPTTPWKFEDGKARKTSRKAS